MKIIWISFNAPKASRWCFNSWPWNIKNVAENFRWEWNIELRSSHCFAERTYVSFGPNHQIRPYRFSIHDAKDVFSRKILWLSVASTKHNSKVIASYYIECIRQLRLLSRAIRLDRGTKNAIFCGIQRFLCRSAEDLISNKNSFLYNFSTSNQLIECWWFIFRRSRLTWWILKTCMRRISWIPV